MKKSFLFTLLFALVSSVFAQKITYCKLAPENYTISIVTGKAGFDSLANVYIKTSCPLKKQGKWNSYAFYSTISLDILSNSAIKRRLYVNKKPYTGFLRLAESSEAATVLVYQFKGGKFERVDEQVNNVQAKPAPSPKPAPKPMPRPIEHTVEKPVLYLYPTEKQEISIKVDLKNQQMIHPYPAYNAEKGWEIIASPDGNLVNKATGKSHYCLFWESEGAKLMDNFAQGFVVKGEESAAFLEEKLAKLGLNEKEANEFIIYWLPQLENNPYNAVYFAQTEYEKVSKLEISPAPETQIRVMMVWQGLQAKINLPEQILPQTPERKGFTVVEWGGTQLKAQEMAR
jgi:hypothetical protein